jgi:hypothetical protein
VSEGQFGFSRRADDYDDPDPELVGVGDIKQVTDDDDEDESSLHVELRLDREDLTKAALVGLLFWVLVRR